MAASSDGGKIGYCALQTIAIRFLALEGILKFAYRFLLASRSVSTPRVTCGSWNNEGEGPAAFARCHRLHRKVFERTPFPLSSFHRHHFPPCPVPFTQLDMVQAVGYTGGGFVLSEKGASLDCLALNPSSAP